jgi:hypothetical protein
MLELFEISFGKQIPFQDRYALQVFGWKIAGEFLLIANKSVNGVSFVDQLSCKIYANKPTGTSH